MPRGGRKGCLKRLMICMHVQWWGRELKSRKTMQNWIGWIDGFGSEWLGLTEASRSAIYYAVWWLILCLCNQSVFVCVLLRQHWIIVLVCHCRVPLSSVLWRWQLICWLICRIHQIRKRKLQFDENKKLSSWLRDCCSCSYYYCTRSKSTSSRLIHQRI